MEMLRIAPGVLAEGIGAAPVSSADLHAPAANTPAVVTYAGLPGRRHFLSGFTWSYSSAPVGGNVQIEDGTGSVVFSLDITTAGAGFIPFAPPKGGTPGAAMVITLAAGGAGVQGKLSITGHWAA
jgi:hypothetical protein